MTRERDVYHPLQRKVVAFVIVRYGVGAPWLHRKAWLGAIERLDLAREDNRVCWRRG